MNDQDRHHHEVQSEQEYLESLIRKHPILGTWPGRKPPESFDWTALRDGYEPEEPISKETK